MGLFSSTIAKIKGGLSRTRDSVGSSLIAILQVGRRIDESLLSDLRTQLIAADFGVATADQIVDELRTAYQQGKVGKGEEVLPFLKEHLKAFWPDADRRLSLASSGPTVVLVAGVNGAGKTTSIAKIASHFRNENKVVMLAACDTFRAAAVEQLAVWSERLGVKIVKQPQGSDPAAVAYDAAEAAVADNADVLLVDTAGRLHTQDNLMRELTKIRNVLRKKIPDAPHEVLLVLDATTGQNAINQAKMFKQAIEVTGIMLTKLDGTAKGGIVAAIRNQLEIPVKLIGVGEQLDDVEPFDPDTFVEALFAE